MEEMENQLAIMLKGVAQHTEIAEIEQKLIKAKKENRPLRIKLGLDPSAPDIHIGHSVVLRKIRQLQDLGHEAVIIIGDYTGMIGDPTGKSKTRKQLSREEVERNANTYLEQIFKIIDRRRTEVHYNSEWLSRMNFGDVIELAAKCTVARMLERDDFNNRYTNHLPLSVHEFFYPLMQAYDSVAIDADLELGGTDQTFNILMGRSLQKTMGKEPQAALFMPILEGLDGVEKMSKSLGNHIGIQEDAKVMFKKVMEIPDALIIRYFELATDELPEKVEAVKEELADGKNPRDVKLELAKIITRLYHGEEEKRAEAFYREAFGSKAVPTDVPVLEIPMECSTFKEVMGIIAAAGYAAGTSELRRLVSQGGVRKNGEKFTGVDEPIADGDILKIGKKLFVKLRKTV